MDTPNPTKNPIENPANVVIRKNEDNKEKSTQEIFIENIFGYFPRVAGAPTWQPRRFSESCAYDTTNDRFYVYNFETQAWHYATLI